MVKRRVLTGQNGHLETESTSGFPLFFEYEIKYLVLKTIVHSDDNFVVQYKHNEIVGEYKWKNN